MEPSNKKGESILVICRCRPFSQREKDLNTKKCLVIDSAYNSIEVKNEEKGNKKFTFDATYDEDTKQQTLYDESCFSLVESVLEGYNATIFAYGQTGCGKSFSMEGKIDDEDLKGVIPRTFEHIFNYISNKSKQGIQYLVTCSYAEIYCEEVHDLLGKNSHAKMDLKMDMEKNFYINDITRVNVSNPSQVLDMFNKGHANRATASTAMNATSSRSHSIFEVLVESQEEIDGKNYIKQSRLNLVDLAGSERQAKTGATGQTLEEAKKINLSLSALGNVITALVDQIKNPNIPIPYRDSKLTLLLKASLGGNSKTLMICALSPSDDNYDETLSTLRYANRAKQIKNKPKVNEDPKDALIKEYQDRIKEMNMLLQDPAALAAHMKKLNPDASDDELKNKIAEYESRFASLNDSILDKDKLLKDQKTTNNSAYFKAQIEINLIKKQKDKELMEAQEHALQIEEKFNSANEELEALKLKYTKLEEKLTNIQFIENDDIHEITEDKFELKDIVEKTAKELHFNKAILYNYVSQELISKVKANTTYDDLNKKYIFPEDLSITDEQILLIDKEVEKVEMKEVNVDLEYKVIQFEKVQAIDQMIFEETENANYEGGVMGKLYQTSPMLFWYLVVIFVIIIIGGVLSIIYTVNAAYYWGVLDATDSWETKVNSRNETDFIYQYCRSLFDTEAKRQDYYSNRNTAIFIFIFTLIIPILMLVTPICLRSYNFAWTSAKNQIENGNLSVSGKPKIDKIKDKETKSSEIKNKDKNDQKSKEITYGQNKSDITQSFAKDAIEDNKHEEIKDGKKNISAIDEIKTPKNNISMDMEQTEVKIKDTKEEIIQDEQVQEVKEENNQPDETKNEQTNEVQIDKEE